MNEPKLNTLNEDEQILISRFNKRDVDAFGQIYSIIYKELHYYSSVICQNTDLVPSDVIHDVFLNVWGGESCRFYSILNLKVYLFSSIKNYLRNYLKHGKVKQSYVNYFDRQSIKSIDEVDIIESELYIQIEEALNLLPEECSEVIRLIVDGWSTDDIAKLLGKQKQTIYNTKTKAISILRKKLSQDKMYTLLTIIGSV